MEYGSVAQCLSGEDNGQAEVATANEVESRKTVLRLRRQMQAGFSSGAVLVILLNNKWLCSSVG